MACLVPIKPTSPVDGASSVFIRAAQFLVLAGQFTSQNPPSPDATMTSWSNVAYDGVVPRLSRPSEDKIVSPASSFSSRYTGS